MASTATESRGINAESINRNNMFALAVQTTAFVLALMRFSRSISRSTKSNFASSDTPKS